MPRPADNVHLFRKTQPAEAWRVINATPWMPNANPPQLHVEVRSLVRPPAVSNPVRKNGTRAMRGYSAHSSTCIIGNGQLTATDPNSVTEYRLEGPIARPDSPDRIPDLALAKRFLSDVRNRTLSGIGSDAMQMNAAMAELGGTVRAVTEYYRNASRGVRKMFGDFPKKTQRRLSQTPAYRWRDIPSDYLGYLYGLAPLADDIANGAEQLSGMAKRLMAFGYEVKGGMARSEPFEQRLDTGGRSFPYVNPAVRRSYARVGYKFEFPQWWIEQVPIVTPFTTAHELTRLSYVVDWVAPLGNYIGAIEAAQFLPYFKEGFEVYGAIEESGDWAPKNLPPGPATWKLTFPRDVHYWYRSHSMDRRVLGPLDGPTLFTSVKIPDVRFELGLSEFAQAAALFAQRFHKPPSNWFRSKLE